MVHPQRTQATKQMQFPRLSSQKRSVELYLRTSCISSIHEEVNIQRAQCFMVSIWTQTNVTHSSPGAGKRDELKMKLGNNTPE